VHYIYVIQNKLNLKCYVGQTNKPKYRWWKHKDHVLKNNRDQVIYSAMKKYGIDNFTFTVIEEWETLDDANEAETFWIELLQTRKKEFGYNIAFGGGNRTMPIHIRKKISATLTGKPNSSTTKFKLGHNINKGDKAFGSILNDDKVREIKILLQTDMYQKDIAKLFGVSNATICMIANGKTWKHIL
jgi:group I intron endonuclease